MVFIFKIALPSTSINKDRDTQYLVSSVTKQAVSHHYFKIDTSKNVTAYVTDVSEPVMNRVAKKDNQCHAL